MTKGDYPRCRTCEFWGRTTKDAGECKVLSRAFKTNAPVIIDRIDVGEDFGCIHHSELELTEGNK